MTEELRIGKRIRAARQQRGITQAELARRMDISASYLNLMEHDRRPVTARVLVRLAGELDLDVRELSREVDPGLAAALREVFSDPVFEEIDLPEVSVSEMASSNPEVAHAVVHLHHAYRAARISAESLAERVLDRQEPVGLDRAQLSSEQVSDFLQRRANHFPELEEAAAAMWPDRRPEVDELFPELAGYLGRRHGVRVRVLTVGEMKGAVRRFDPGRRELLLSETLRRGSRYFQLAYQVGLLSYPELLESLSSDPQLTSAESRALCRVALANYFAAAVVMPYDEFLAGARDVRYDVDLLGHRFRASFEQVCHRLTTLARPGSSGIPFHMVRIDMAGNISKKFSATGVRLPRFSGLCPLWNVHAAFQQPGLIRSQISRLPDGSTYFSIARTVRKHRGGFHTPQVLYAIGLGCDIAYASELVYADGVDLDSPRAAVPVGVTCRLCERTDCQARAMPSLRSQLRVDENVRGVSFFAPLDN